MTFYTPDIVASQKIFSEAWTRRNGRRATLGACWHCATRLNLRANSGFGRGLPHEILPSPQEGCARTLFPITPFLLGCSQALDNWGTCTAKRADIS